MSESVLALIPARGGSKGLARKNIRSLAGRPLIAWTIEAAQCARGLERIVVSTDDSEIAEVARACGADVPFLRPAELAADDSALIPVLLHALDWLERHRRFRPQYVVLLQPTSPLRSASDIDSAIELAFDKDAHSVVSVCPAKCHPYWAKRVADDGRLEHLLPDAEKYLSRQRQALVPAYRPNGALYLVRHDVLREQRTFYTNRSYAYVMPEERSLDIDTAWDFHLAQLILAERRERD